MPFISKDGSSWPRTAAAATVAPEANRVQAPSPRRRCSSFQPSRSLLVTLPTTFVGWVIRAPSSGCAIETEGGAPLAAVAVTVTVSLSLPASAPSLAFSCRRYAPGASKDAVVVAL
jgi:hypothetical protein